LKEVTTMKEALRVLVVGIFGVSMFAISACGPSSTTSGDDGDPPETGPGPGPDPTPVASCAAPACTTDLVAARSALTSGDYQRAFDLYQCADTPEAAFGAGLTRTLLAFEGSNADAVLADLGQSPLPMTDIFGENGVLGREAARWDGDGNLTVSGAATATLPFDRAQYEVSDEPTYSIGYFRARDRMSPAGASLSISFDGYPDLPAFTSGTVLAVTVDCSSSFPSITADPRLGYLDLSFESGESTYWCNLPYYVPTGQCESDGGNIVVTSAATAPGQQASYQFNNLLLNCYVSGPAAEGEGLVRVSGTVSAVAVSESLDLTGLHPLFHDSDSIPAQIPAGTTLNALLEHGGAAAAELEHAACFFKIASQGSGHIYDLPGVLFGGSDVPISKGDTELVAALTLLGAAAGHLAWVHEIDMPLGQIICSNDPGATPCLSNEEFVSRFNRAFASDFHPGRLLVVERLVDEALPLIDQGLADLDATSLVVRNGASTAGLDAMRAIVQGLSQSIRTGGTTFPRVTPAIPINLKALFENPRNPRSLGNVLEYVEDCDGDYCYTSSGIDIDFISRYFDGRIDADWENGDYEYLDNDAVEAAFEEIDKQSVRYLNLPY
jgi:hypothetical protein